MLKRLTDPDLIGDLLKLRDRAMRADLPVTTRALTEAVNTYGWELAGDLDAKERYDAAFAEAARKARLPRNADQAGKP